MLHRVLLAIPAIAMLLATGQVHARCGGCADPCAYAGTCGAVSVSVPCEPQYVEKVVRVPTWITETRKVMVTEVSRETRERTVTVHKVVPETKDVTREVTVMVPTKMTKSITEVVCVPVTREVTKEITVKVPVTKEVTEDVTVKVPVYKDVEQQCTVMVPHKEVRHGVRKVCSVVPVTEKRMVTRDRGHWEEQMVSVPGGSHRHGRRCGGCSSCDNGGCGSACWTVNVLRKCWVPNVVQEEIDVTCHKRVVEDHPYDYTVVVCKPEVRTRTVKVCDYEDQVRTVTRKVCTYETQTRTVTYKVCEIEKQERTRDVTYIVCVPTKKTITETVTVCKTVPVEVQQTYTVCVPNQVEKEVQVRVCQLVEKTVQVPVNGNCGYGCGKGRRCRRGC